jgi:hypothetical protein
MNVIKMLISYVKLDHTLTMVVIVYTPPLSICGSGVSCRLDCCEVEVHPFPLSVVW